VIWPKRMSLSLISSRDMVVCQKTRKWNCGSIHRITWKARWVFKFSIRYYIMGSFYFTHVRLMFLFWVTAKSFECQILGGSAIWSLPAIWCTTVVQRLKCCSPIKRRNNHWSKRCDQSKPNWQSVRSVDVLNHTRFESFPNSLSRRINHWSQRLFQNSTQFPLTPIRPTPQPNKFTISPRLENLIEKITLKTINQIYPDLLTISLECSVVDDFHNSHTFSAKADHNRFESNSISSWSISMTCESGGVKMSISM
jgi:hypothetical protein